MFSQQWFIPSKLMQIVAPDFNLLILQWQYYNGSRKGIEHESEGKGGTLAGQSDKHLTLAPRCCGLNVACLLRAGFGNRGLSGPSPLQEPLWDCHGMEPMH